MRMGIGRGALAAIGIVAAAGCLGSGGDDDDSGASGKKPGKSVSGVISCETDAGCDDGIACTRDSCVDGLGLLCSAVQCIEGRCKSTAQHDECETGACDVRSGCVETGACADDEDCEDDDPCTVRERCDPSRRRCIFDVLDGDRDGFVPIVCGGNDCDDDDPRTPALTDSTCDQADNDCDGEVDEDVDFDNDPLNCAFCDNVCESGICEEGRCVPCGGQGEACCEQRCDLICDTGDCLSGRSDPQPLCVEVRPAYCEGAVGTVTCLDGTCTACGALGGPCCDDLVCDQGVCTDGTCEERTCGSAPEPATMPVCTEEDRACLAGCQAGATCLLTCFPMAQGECVECLASESRRCEEEMGCGAAYNAYRCCLMDECGSEATSCEPCERLDDLAFNCSLGVVSRCTTAFTDSPCLGPAP